MLGYAWQKGLVPLSDAALLRAIESNGVAVASTSAASRGAAAPRSTCSAWSAPQPRAGDRGADAAKPGRNREARRIPDRLPGCRLCRAYRVRKAELLSGNLKKRAA
jgi:hypothetical protein